MKNKKKTYTIVGALAVVLVAVIVFIGMVFYPKWKAGSEIAKLLQAVLSAENQSMHMVVSVDVAGEQIYMETDLYLLKEDETDYLIIKQEDYAFYIADGLFVLENGNAYKLSDETKSSTEESLFQEILLMSDYVDIAKVQTEENTLYSMSITGDDAKELLAALKLDGYEGIDALEELKLNISAKDGSLEKIAIVGSTKFDDEVVDITILFSDFVVLEENTNLVPQEIKEIVQTVDRESLFDLSKDLYRLISAAYELTSRDILEGVVELQANCGIISFNKEYQLSELQTRETPVTNGEEVAGIPEGIAFICLEGDISCVQEENQYIYTLELDEQDMEKLVKAIAPEVNALVLNLTSGTAYITIENGIISGMEIQIGGTLNMLITEVDAEVSAKFIFE